MEDNNNVIDMTPKSKKEWKQYSVVGSILVAILLIVALVINNLYIVKQNEYKVVRQFGEVTRVIQEPGLNYKLPFIQSVSSLPKHLLLYDVPSAEINTFDKKRIIVDIYAVWRITDSTKMIETLRTVNGAEGRLSTIIYSNVRNELGRLDYDEIINVENSARGDFNELVREQANQTLATNQNGIEVVDIRMMRTELPESNEQAVFNRMVSERESKAQEYLSQGDAEATKIRAETDREVQVMLATANAEAKVIIGQGEQEAARIYNESYNKDAQFYTMYRTLESYRSTLQGEPVIILPIDSPYTKFLLGKVE